MHPMSPSRRSTYRAPPTPVPALRHRDGLALLLPVPLHMYSGTVVVLCTKPLQPLIALLPPSAEPRVGLDEVTPTVHIGMERSTIARPVTLEMGAPEVNVKRIWLVLPFVMAACDRVTDTGPIVVPMSIGGNWSFSVNVSNAEVSVSCQIEGTMSVRQAAYGIANSAWGLAACTDHSETYTQEVDWDINEGSVYGTEVSFRDLQCIYMGSGSGSPRINQLSGNVACTGPQANALWSAFKNYTFVGTWQASRYGP